MKKVYVVTVYNSLNSGSFLQATSLYKAIEGLGYDVAFLDTGARNLWKRAFLEFLFMIKNRNFGSAFGKFKQARALTNELNNFKVVKINDLEDCDDKVFVLGSDEIWNVARRDMAEYPVFWGEGLPLGKCFSYAPSINTAREEHVKKYNFVRNALENLFAISVRDHHSYEVLKALTDRDILEVCDPTLLIEPKEYYELKAQNKFSDYILIYLYAKRFSDEDVEAIRKFAKEKNKKLVAFGSNFRWCDMNVNGTPWDFISYIEGADYVCTGTFHGTLFSALFGKNFAVIGQKSNKVTELLERFNLSDRVADSKSINRILETDYDRSELASTISQMREIGLQYLADNIRKI